MRKAKVDIEIKNHFIKQDFFNREELYKFYLKYEPDLNERTFGWRVFDLKKKNIIISIKRGVYKISDKEYFNPPIDSKTKKLSNYINKNFFDPDYIIWTSSWLNDLSLHISFKNFHIIEVPYNLKDIVFEKLKESGIVKPFLLPDESMIQKYVLDEEDSAVIKTLITRSPVKRIKKIKIPTLEKLLVDLYSDTKTFYMYQGYELKEIFRNAIQRYVINWSKLINYSKRRGQGNEIKKYLSENFMDLTGDILNDHR
jgi:hypothetical protein